MTPDQVDLVQETWSQVEPISATAADLFYDRLFELDPSLKPMFKGDMQEQKQKLMRMIGMVVKGLKDLEPMVPAIQNLGRRHVDYGVKNEHYATVGEALLWTLEQGLSEAYTPEVEQSWTAAYTTLAKVMQAAAESVSVEPAH